MEFFHISPSDLESLVFFLLPGFIFMFFFFYQIPDKKKSDFIIIFISVICSVIFNFITNFIFNAITYLSHLKLTIQPDNPWTNWVSIFLGILFSIVLARVVQSENKFFVTTQPSSKEA
jgi:hypothetical protein